MPDSRVLKNLRIEGHDPVLIMNSPPEYEPLLTEIDARIHTEPQLSYTFAHVFVKSEEEIERDVRQAAQYLEEDGHLWISFPKPSSTKYKGDISRDHGVRILVALGFEPITQISIDDDWSALRFEHVDYARIVDDENTMSERAHRRSHEARESDR
jgi:hypothetical protein